MANEPLESIKFPGIANTFTVPAVDNTLAVQGAVADAKKVGDEISDIKADLSDIEEQIEGVSGLSEEAKTALLNCFQHVAWIDEHGQDYYDTLEEALTDTWTVTNALYYCNTTNSKAKVIKGTSYNATITPFDGYTLNGAEVSIIMGGVDVTRTAYINGSISITEVTGDLQITVSAVSQRAIGIEATYTPGSNVIYNVDELDSLRQYLIVTATLENGQTVVVTEYTLNGTLNVGINTITVSYQSVSDTFSVTVEDYNNRHSLVFPDNTLTVLSDYQGNLIDTNTMVQFVLEPATNNAVLLSRYGNKTAPYMSGSMSDYYFIPVPEDAKNVKIKMRPSSLYAYISFVNLYTDSVQGHHFFRWQDSQGWVQSGRTVNFEHRNNQYMCVSFKGDSSGSVKANVESVSLTFGTN